MDTNYVDLSIYDNTSFQTGAGRLKMILWFYCNLIFFKSMWFPFMGPKKALLRAFGAKVGKGVILKPSVNIKYPWKLVIGDHAWIGEGVWIDNLGQISIGDHVCLSQGAMLLCGNHNYKKKTFDLQVGEITIERGAWVGAKAVVCPGITLANHSVLTVNSVATASTLPYGIYQGNPAKKIKTREIS